MEVNNKPKFLTDKSTEWDHASYVINHNTDEELIIPLMIRGITSSNIPHEETNTGQIQNLYKIWIDLQ
jgi:hypothetical protein